MRKTLDNARDHISDPKSRGRIEFIDIGLPALQQNIAFARGERISANIRRANALKLPGKLKQRQHDAVVTDAFIQFFDHRGKQRVLREWNHALRTHGTVLTTFPYDLPEEARKLVKEPPPVEERLKKLKPKARELGLDPESAIAEIREFKKIQAELSKASPGFQSGFKSIEHIKKACADAGFEVEFDRHPKESEHGYSLDAINKWAWIRVKLTKVRGVK